MEDNFNDNDLERFLQSQVGNHRMYPTDTVWREIDKKLHGEKRWPALTVAAVLLLGATILICMHFTPKPNIFAVQPVAASHKNDSRTSVLNLSSSERFNRQEKKYTNRTVTATNGAKTSAISQSASPSSLENMGVAGSKLVSPQKSEPIVSTVSLPHHQPIEDVSTDVLPSTLPITINTRKFNLTSEQKSASIPKLDNEQNLVDILKDPKDVAEINKRNKQAKPRFSYQLYIAPSISYRQLLEDRSMATESNTGGPVGLNYVTDVNKVVRHKPGTGFEAGISFKYNLSDRVRVKSGFQFNMRQYSIEAYRSNTEVASIALMGNNRIDTVNAIAFYRNNNGYSSAELVNRYYQISLPVGIEWQITGSKHIQLNIAGSIQPTYLLNRNAYLISTNFKNYAELPGMVRQWNLNSNVEAFISINAGDFKWQLGPQIRYQPYSTFIPQYAIKEHLMDYGLKLGVSKVIP